MSRILTITISALMLAGCAATNSTGTYDKSAMQNAAVGLQIETVACKAKWTAKEFKTYSEWQACQLTAERSFARTIASTKMDAFEAYAADMQVLAADRDAHRVTDRQVRSRANDIQWRFFADCGCKPQSARMHSAAGGFYEGISNMMGPQPGESFSPRGRELGGT